MGLRYCLGAGTPLPIRSLMEPRLPSVQIGLPVLSGGPTGPPVASAPWQAPQEPPLNTAWPRATWAAVAPGGTGRADPSAPAAGAWGSYCGAGAGGARPPGGPRGS